MTGIPSSSQGGGDPEFRRIFEAEFSYVWKSLRRLGIRQADLEDVTHDVFVTYYRKRADYDPSRPLRPWLFGIAFRVASDHKKLARHRNERLDDPDDPPDSRADVEASVERRRAQRLVVAALERVDPDRRAVFVMHELDGFGMPEIADALGIPLNTGYSRLRLARGEFTAAIKDLRGAGGER